MELQDLILLLIFLPIDLFEVFSHEGVNVAKVLISSALGGLSDWGTAAALARAAPVLGATPLLANLGVLLLQLIHLRFLFFGHFKFIFFGEHLVEVGAAVGARGLRRL